MVKFGLMLDHDEKTIEGAVLMKGGPHNTGLHLQLLLGKHFLEGKTFVIHESDKVFGLIEPSKVWAQQKNGLGLHFNIYFLLSFQC